MTITKSTLTRMEKDLNSLTGQYMKSLSVELPENAEALAKKYINEQINELKREYKKNYDILRNDITNACLKKRIHCSGTVLPNMIKDIHVCYKNTTPYHLFTIFANPMTVSYDVINEDNDLLLAAAIWIADEIKKAGRIQGVIDLMPDFYISEYDLNINKFKSADHFESIIKNIVYILQHRHDDSNVIPSNPKYPRYILDDTNAYDRQTVESDNYNRYVALMNLVPPEALAEAEGEFYGCFTDFMFKVADGYDVYDLIQKQNAIVAKQRLESLKLSGGSALFAGNVFPPFLKMPNLPENGTLISNMDRLNVEEFTQRINSFSYNKAIFKRLSLCLWTPSSYLQNDECSDIYKSMTNSLEGFTVKDPFKLCAALFILADENDKLVWSYAPCQMMFAVHHMLPWVNIPPLSNVSKAILQLPLDDENEEDEEEKTGQINYRSLIPYKNIFSELGVEEIYNRLESARNFKVNFSNILYAYTGYILPRTEKYPKELVSTLIDKGVDNVTAEKLAFGIQILRSLKSKEAPLDTFDYSDFDEDISEEELFVEDDPKEMSDDELTALRKEIKALREEAHHYAQALKKEKVSAQQLKTNNDVMAAELADLRELAYNLNNKELNIIPEIKNNVTLPYTVKHRTTVFGGHDSWAKAVKPMLSGNIRFVDKDQNPSAEMIRKSDVVWVQTNCMNHPYYWSILQTCKNAGVKFRYFTNASAEICARQIADQDISFEK